MEQAATEKEINLAVVLKLKELLEEQGIRVVLTRDKDIFMKLEERVQIANGERADLFISIHCNYYEKDSSIYGLECYYCKSGEEGKHYAEKIMETIEELLYKPVYIRKATVKLRFTVRTIGSFYYPPIGRLWRSVCCVSLQK